MKEYKLKMAEAAVLYYEKNLTQQEIAQILKLSRQTVSKLLSDAIKEKIVEIKIHDPARDLKDLEQSISDIFNIKKVCVCCVSKDDDTLRRLMTARAAADYITEYVTTNAKNIAVSWGRMIQLIISEMPKINTSENTVFPLFGATERKQSYFLSNELAHNFAEKIDAKTNYAWFPYKPDSAEDCDLFKRTSYYKNMQNNWNNIDIAVVGIGNAESIGLLEKSFGSRKTTSAPVCDIATHTFDRSGELTDADDNTLCASVNSLKKAGQVIAVASGSNKTEAITAALRSKIITGLITDEYTAKEILKNCGI